MRRTPMPPRTSYMTRSVPLIGSGGLPRTSRLVLTGADGAPVVPLPQRRRTADTGFSRAVKLAVRKRAGCGEVADAACEACSVWLGRYGGQVQHIVARGMGGTSDPVLSTAANAALLCGTAQSGDHGLAESRDPEMGAMGFWLPRGSDPRLEPMMLHSAGGSGITVWRAEDGLGGDGTGYLYQRPDGGDAA